jgi:hypothetical protein
MWTLACLRNCRPRNRTPFLRMRWLRLCAAAEGGMASATSPSSSHRAKTSDSVSKTGESFGHVSVAMPSKIKRGCMMTMGRHNQGARTGLFDEYG